MTWKRWRGRERERERKRKKQRNKQTNTNQPTNNPQPQESTSPCHCQSSYALIAKVCETFMEGENHMVNNSSPALGKWLESGLVDLNLTHTGLVARTTKMKKRQRSQQDPHWDIPGKIGTWTFQNWLKPPERQKLLPWSSHIPHNSSHCSVQSG